PTAAASRARASAKFEGGARTLPPPPALFRPTLAYAPRLPPASAAHSQAAARHQNEHRRILGHPDRQLQGQGHDPGAEADSRRLDRGLGQEDERRGKAAFVFVEVVLGNPGRIEATAFGVDDLRGGQPVPLGRLGLIEQASKEAEALGQRRGRHLLALPPRPGLSGIDRRPGFHRSRFLEHVHRADIDPAAHYASRRPSPRVPPPGLVVRAGGAPTQRGTLEGSPMSQMPLFASPSETVLVEDGRGRIVYTPGFLPAGTADAWFAELRESVAWQTQRRRMYDREVDVPRLLAHFRLAPEEGCVPDAIRAAAHKVVAVT